MRGVGWEADVTARPDIGRGRDGPKHSCAIRRGMSKKRATAIFDLSLGVCRPSEFVKVRSGSRYHERWGSEELDDSFFLVLWQGARHEAKIEGLK